MSPEMYALTMVILLLAMVINGFHLAFSLIFISVVFGIAFRGLAVFSLFMHATFGTMQTEVLVAVPLFVLMGAILGKSGATERLYDAMYKLFGPLRGGLAITTIVICTLFAACTGVIVASVTTMAMVALPAMLKRNYNKSLATGCICAGGTLGILIPPSVMLVIYGPMAQLSVARLFAAALFPGLLLSGLYIAYIVICCIIQPNMAPAIPVEETSKEDIIKIIKDTLFNLLPVLFLIIAVMGSILGGLTAPTEASAMGAIGAILIAWLYKKLNKDTLKQSLFEAGSVAAMAFYILIGAKMFTSVFLSLRGGKLVERFLLNLPFGDWFVLFVMMFIVFILGMFVDWIGILYIVVPLFIPIAIKLGYDPLWFGMLICINLQMSFLSPPFAYSIFFVKGVAPPSVTIFDIYRGVVPFVILQMIALFLCIVYPQIIMWLPRVTLG